MGKAVTTPLLDGGLAVETKGEVVKYDVGNSKLSAEFNSNFAIERYVAIAAVPVLAAPGEAKAVRKEEEPVSQWQTRFFMNNKDVTAGEKKIYCRGKIFRIEQKMGPVILIVTAFCDENTNAIFQWYRLKNLEQRIHKFEISINVRFDLGHIIKWEGKPKFSQDNPITLDYMKNHQAVLVKTKKGRAAFLGATQAPGKCDISGIECAIKYGLEIPAKGEQELCLFLTGGWSVRDARKIFYYAGKNWQKCYAAAEGNSAWVSSRFHSSSPVLNSIFTASLNVALSMYREIPQYGFRYFGGGAFARYVFPPRTYFRDSYWSVQVLLPFKPELVKRQILALAPGVHKNGQCPSGVLGKGFENAEEGLKLYERDWWSDHYDSPSYFVMMVYDYLCWTGEFSILNEKVEDVSIQEKITACVDYLKSCDRDNDFLFEKGLNMRDWADCVYRSQWVTYDLTLYYRAIVCLAEIARRQDMKVKSSEYFRLASRVKQAINKKMWNCRLGYYVNYKRKGSDKRRHEAEIFSFYHDPAGWVEIKDKGMGREARYLQDFSENHLAIETLLTVLYGIADEKQSRSILSKAEAMLETRNNSRQPYGDWGVMSNFPLYQNKVDLYALSGLDFCYHNGADWPFLDGIYALVKLLRRNSEWFYPLTRWWTYGLEQNWLTPVEYQSPLHGRGGSFQPWDSTAAMAMIMGGFGFYPDLESRVNLTVPPWGDSELKGIRFRGDIYDIQARKRKITVTKNGKFLKSGTDFVRLKSGENKNAIKK